MAGYDAKQNEIFTSLKFLEYFLMHFYNDIQTCQENVILGKCYAFPIFIKILNSWLDVKECQEKVSIRIC